MGRGGLFVFSKFRGDLEERASLGLILVEEGGQAEHVQREAFRVSAGYDKKMGMIRLISLGDHLGFGDGCRASAIAVHLLGVPVDVVAHAFLAGLLEVFGLDDDVLVHGNKILALDHEFGHWDFSCWMFPTPQPLPTSVSRGQIGQPAPKGFSPSSARRSLQAASSVM